MNPSAPLLEMRGVSKRYPGVQALDNVDFTLRRGEIHALMGENGAGKSTLIQVLTGAQRRDAGTVLLNGRAIDPHSPQAAERLGVSTVYQEINLIPRLSLAENICLNREPTRFGLVRWRAAGKRAAAALARLGLKLDVWRELASCSPAIQQMTAIARALDVAAHVLILDEPTSSLDAREVEELFAALRKLRAEGLGIVFVTHFLDQVDAVSDRITVLRDGRRVGEFETARLPRVELVGHMLGKPYEAPAPRTGETNSPTAWNADTKAAAETSPIFIQTRQLGRRGSVSGIHLTIRRGETVGLAGLLGSGRTETARLLFGIDKPDRGEIQMEGRTISPRSPRQAIALGFAFTPENRKVEGVVPNLSVLENIVLAMQASAGLWRKLPRRRQLEIADELIRALGIKTPSPAQPITHLSGGNQQKALLARWLANRPRLLILDEPTRGIDIGAKAEIEKLIAALRAQGMAILFISSELEETVRACARVVVLRDRAQVAELSGSAISVAGVMAAIAGTAHAS